MCVSLCILPESSYVRGKCHDIHKSCFHVYILYIAKSVVCHRVMRGQNQPYMYLQAENCDCVKLITMTIFNEKSKAKHCNEHYTKMLRYDYKWFMIQ